MDGKSVCKQHSGDSNVGRKSSLTPEAKKTIVDALSLGAWVEDAARSAGIHPATFYAWMDRGEAEFGNGEATEFSEFYEDATRARVQGRIVAVGHLRRAMPEDWRAAAWYLERSDPANWGRREHLTHTGSMRTEVVEIPNDAERLADVVSIIREAGALPEE
jgi:transposase-like protein